MYFPLELSQQANEIARAGIFEAIFVKEKTEAQGAKKLTQG